jgi:ubiquinone/menaquinone biosynthesis C-methylase UbiE
MHNREKRSIPTRGRTLDHAAGIYDCCEPILMMGRQEPYNLSIVEALNLQPQYRVLDLGCGTGVLTRLIADHLNAADGGFCLGIDAAAKMIAVAEKKRSSPACHFEVMAAEDLTLEDDSFDAVVSSLFFHHVPLDLKKKSLLEAFRVLRPGGRIVIADMHTPATFMGALVSFMARWFFLQPQIGENTAGVMPGLISQAGFSSVAMLRMYFGYIALFAAHKPLPGEADRLTPEEGTNV